MQRKILREDQLYFIDNQVEAIDTLLADTEDLSASHPELAELRTQLRESKAGLEKKAMEWIANAEGSELPEDLSPEENAEAMVEAGKEFIMFADEALGQKVKKIDDLHMWEDPLTTLNSYLADSEPYMQAKPELAGIRADVRNRKEEIQKRIHEVVGAWRASDMSGGD